VGVVRRCVFFSEATSEHGIVGVDSCVSRSLPVLHCACRAGGLMVRYPTSCHYYLHIFGAFMAAFSTGTANALSLKADTFRYNVETKVLILLK
jgi:hypothetical protein